MSRCFLKEGGRKNHWICGMYKPQSLPPILNIPCNNSCTHICKYSSDFFWQPGHLWHLPPTDRRDRGCVCLSEKDAWESTCLYPGVHLCICVSEKHSWFTLKSLPLPEYRPSDKLLKNMGAGPMDSAQQIGQHMTLGSKSATFSVKLSSVSVFQNWVRAKQITSVKSVRYLDTGWTAPYRACTRFLDTLYDNVNGSGLMTLQTLENN